jgi:hypothetical protein
LETNLGKKSARPPILTNKLGMLGYVCNPSYIGCISRKVTIQGWPSKNARPYLRSKTKRAGSMAQVIENLPSKCKALSSTPVLFPLPPQKPINIV